MMTTSKDELSSLLQRYEQACSDLKGGHLQEAKSQFHYLASKVPLEPRFYFGLGLTLQQLGLMEQALRQFTICVHLDPADAAATYRLGESLQLLGETEDARAMLTDALKLCGLPETDPQLRAVIEARMQTL